MTTPQDFDRLRPHEHALLAVGGPLLLVAVAASRDWARAQAGGGASQGVAPRRALAPPSAPSRGAGA